jgi:hypothetical protein
MVTAITYHSPEPEDFAAPQPAEKGQDHGSYVNLSSSAWCMLLTLEHFPLTPLAVLALDLGKESFVARFRCQMGRWKV